MSDINIVLENRDNIHVAVEEKDINVEVPAGKDGRSLHPRGEWSASAAYAYLDLVSYQGSSYVATKAVPAGTLPTNTSYWMLSAEKGEPGGAVWGNITGDLSDQTDLQAALLAKAPVILSSASGSIASFSDGSASPVTALTVSIEPVQDLLGYDNPWPAGGGKNLFQTTATSKTESGVTWTVNADGSITASGTATGYSNLVVGEAKVNASMGSVTVKGEGISTTTNVIFGNITLLDSNDTTLLQITSGGTQTTYTTDISSYSTADHIRVSIKRNNNVATSGTVKIQVEQGSTASSWTPYSNVCPISGHTACNIYHEDEYDPTATPKVTIDLDGTRYGAMYDALTGEMTLFNGCKDMGDLSWTVHSSGILYATISDMLATSGATDILNSVYATYPNAISGANSASNLMDNCQISRSYGTTTPNIYVKDANYSDGTTFATAMSGQLVVYPLATPLTVQLTPSQLSTLLGTNNIWADTGDVAVEYRADTKLFVQGQIAQTAKVTRQMIADSATADGKAPKSLATNELIIVGDELRKATANIGNGSAITASNSTTATLADVIKALQ